MRTLPCAILLSFLLAGCARSAVDDARVSEVEPIAAAVDRERLMADVHAIVEAHQAEMPFDCAAHFELDHIDQVRRPVCDLTRNAARTFMIDRLQSLGLGVRTEDSDIDGFDTQNVIADLVGTSRPKEVVVVSAHFDAFHAGADDNTTGVAAVLELARVLSARRFERTIRFVGFDLEEFGLVGSTRFVQAQPQDEVIVAAINFDCIGYADSTPGSQRSLPGLPVPDQGDFVAIIANDQSATEAAQVRALASRLELLPTETVVAPRDGAFPITGNLMRSDHAPFWLAGKTALFLTDTANFRNPNYHTDTDTPDTLDPDFLAGVTRVAAASLAYWAEETP